MAVRRRDLDIRPVSRPKPGHESDLLGLDAPEREFERSQRGRVAPLQVVERHEQRLLLRQLAERRDHREAEPEWIDGTRLVRIDSAQGDVERTRLRRGQVELRHPDGLEQLGEDAERELSLGFCRAGGERSEACVPRPVDRLLEQRGLAVAGATTKHDRLIPLADRPKEPVDRRELRVASDERRHASTNRRPVPHQNLVAPPDVCPQPTA